ncbi:hypothetical protein B0T26DRAFT_511365 [Lasiosphaeria miniovina]|uniref:Uncharacterized protein n=1 Tax=Lasiosphaeria miniovina TaxID=1954250 RepID=A0AA40DK47_9PEZI|nr:uncharacterized protein B0T26DRAFT_511365 [Lasiosphaeria miniovina]KAK0703762.1 hypothetical protein B0T26DRAFT_511365 [Lasiosphaeria miniovina]
MPADKNPRKLDQRQAMAIIVLELALICERSRAGCRIKTPRPTSSVGPHHGRGSTRDSQSFSSAPRPYLFGSLGWKETPYCTVRHVESVVPITVAMTWDPCPARRTPLLFDLSR